MELEVSDIYTLLKESRVRSVSYSGGKFLGRGEVLDRVLGLQESMVKFKNDLLSREFLIIEVVDTADEVNSMLQRFLETDEYTQPEIDSKACLYKRIQELQRANSELLAKFRINIQHPLSRMEQYRSLKAEDEKPLKDRNSRILKDTIRAKDNEKEQLNKHIQILTRSLECIKQTHEERRKDLKTKYRTKLDSHLNKLACVSNCIYNFLAALKKLPVESEEFEIERSKLVEMLKMIEVPEAQKLTAYNLRKHSEDTKADTGSYRKSLATDRNISLNSSINNEQRALTNRPMSKSIIVKGFNDIIYSKQNTELHLKRRIADLEGLINNKNLTNTSTLKSKIELLVRGMEQKFIVFLNDFSNRANMKEGRLKDLAGAFIRLTRITYGRTEKPSVNTNAFQRAFNKIEEENKGLREKLIEFEELFGEDIKTSFGHLRSKDLLLQRNQQVMTELTKSLKRCHGQVRSLEKHAVEIKIIGSKKGSLHTALGESDLTIKDTLLSISDIASKRTEQLLQSILNVFKDRINTLMNSAQQLKNHIEVQKNEEIANKKKRSEEKAILDEKEEVIKKLQDEIKSLTEEKEDIKELSEKVAKEKIEELNATMEQNKLEMDQQVEKIKKQLNEEKKQAGAKEKLVENLKTEAKQLADNLNKEEEKNAKIENLNKEYKNQLNELSKKLQEANKKLMVEKVDSECQCDQLIKEIEKRNKEVSNFLEELNNSRKKAEADYTIQINNFKQKLADLNDELAKKEEIARNWELVNEKLKIELEMEKCKSGFADIERGRFEQASALEEDLDSIENLESRIKELQSELDKRDKENSEVMEGLLKKSKDLQILNNALNSELEEDKATSGALLSPRALAQSGTDANSISIDEVLRYTDNIRQLIINCAESVPLK